MFRMIRLAIMLVAAFVSASANSHSDVSTQLEMMQLKVDEIYRIMKSENCSVNSLTSGWIGRRSMFLGSDDIIQLNVHKKLFDRLSQQLKECRHLYLNSYRSSTGLPTFRPAMIPTTTPTAHRPIPQQCQRAMNLTEDWRLDHGGSRIKPFFNSHNIRVPNDDTKKMIDNSRPYFRFTGSAGKKLLNKCVPGNSCGVEAAFWSDATMPSEVGVRTRVQLYASFGDKCKIYKESTLMVIKCSTTPDDYVYQYQGDRHDYFGFCGMV